MGSTDALVVYDGLPVASGGAHGLRTKDVFVARSRVDGFVDACVRVDEESPWTVSTTTKDAPELVAYLTAAIGRAPASRSHGVSWGRISDDAAERVLQALSGIATSDVPAAHRNGVTLRRSRFGRLIAPATGEPYAGTAPEDVDDFLLDGYGTRLGVTEVSEIHHGASSSIRLLLPFPADDRLAAAAAHVQENLPFAMSAKQWRLWKRGKSGFSSRRMPSPLA